MIEFLRYVFVAAWLVVGVCVVAWLLRGGKNYQPYPKSAEELLQEIRNKSGGLSE